MFGLHFFLFPLQDPRIHVSSVYTLQWETELRFIYKGIKVAGVIANNSTKGTMAQTSMKTSHAGHFTGSFTRAHGNIFCTDI